MNKSRPTDISDVLVTNGSQEVHSATQQGLVPFAHLLQLDHFGTFTTCNLFDETIDAGESTTFRSSRTDQESNIGIHGTNSRDGRNQKIYAFAVDQSTDTDDGDCTIVPHHQLYLLPSKGKA